MASSGAGRAHRALKDTPAVALSKALSWILRHGAEKSGLKLQPGGFLYVEEILALPKYRKYTMEEVKHVVITNEKQRFYMEEEASSGKLRIRANQGHTMQVEELELQPINDPTEVPSVVHGTYYKFWESIKAHGLSKMKRNHIHFAPGEAGVISGMRTSCQIVIYIDLPKATADGLKFYQSSNDVILSPGDENGNILPKYFLQVLDRNTRKQLL